MAEPYFIWNGIDSRDMGLVVTKPPAQILPEERLKQVTVPGRMGTLTTRGGAGIYNSYIKSIGIGNRKRVDAQVLAAWLRGSGTLILSTEPGFLYRARVIKEAQLERNFSTVFSGTVSFSVQPGKAQVPQEADIIVTEENTPIYNPGDLPARPIYRVEGLGKMGVYLTPTATRSQLIVDPTGQDRIVGLTGAVIDSDSMTVTTLDGSDSLTDISYLQYNGIEGLWIPPHETVYLSAGVSDSDGSTTRMTVTPRWRWL